MRRIPVLDGWRGIAISMVLLCHAGQHFYNDADFSQSVLRFGAFGVDIFFGLSGLLITRLLLEQWRTSGSFRLPEFYIRRTFRILPPCLLFLAAFTVLGLWKSRLEFVSCLLFFRNYIPLNMTRMSSLHLWSLAVEEHFYLLWPPLLAFLGPLRSKNAAAGLALGFGLWRMVESQFQVPLLPHVQAHFRTDLRLDALLWGCVVAFVLDSAKERAKFKAQMRLPVWLTMTGVLILSIVFYSQLTSVLIAVLIPAMLAGTLVHPEWKVSRALTWGPLVWVGRISYGLYLWQIFFASDWEPTKYWWLQWPWDLVFPFGVVILSYYFVEVRMIAKGRKLAHAYSEKHRETRTFLPVAERAA